MSSGPERQPKTFLERAKLKVELNDLKELGWGKRICAGALEVVAGVSLFKNWPLISTIGIAAIGILVLISAEKNLKEARRLEESSQLS